MLCASSAILAYGLAAYTSHINLIIYVLAVLIGGLIGFEIPLVTRLNETYEELRSNIATVMEKAGFWLETPPVRVGHADIVWAPAKMEPYSMIEPARVIHAVKTVLED